MHFSLGEIHCIYCNSPNIICCEWREGSESEDFDDWYFDNSIDEISQQNFDNTNEIMLLCQCKNCEKWFNISVKSEEVGSLILPFSKEKANLVNPILEVEPITQEPRNLHIGFFELQIIWFRYISLDKIYNKFIGPFYPYPIGEYLIKCKVNNPLTNIKDHFNCKIEKIKSPWFIDRKYPDIAFYEFSIKWIDNTGNDILQYLLNMNKEIENNKMEFAIEKYFGSDDTINDFKKTILNIEANEKIKDGIKKSASLARNIQAYRFINWFENEIRDYMWNIYCSIYKPENKDSKWWKGCFPKQVIEHIRENRLKERKLIRHNISRFPLDYADFDDIFLLINKERMHFNRMFNLDIDAFKGHFQYIKQYRNIISHSRFITNDNLMELQYHARKFTDLIGSDLFKNNSFPFYKPPKELS